VERIANLSNMKMICPRAKVEWIEMQGHHAGGLG